MPKFSYKARKGPQKLEHGTIEAETRSAAIRKLTQMGYSPIKVSLEGEGLKEKARVTVFFKKIRHRELTIFSRQLSNLLEAGLTLHRALTLLQQQTENRYLQDIIRDIAELVKDGRSLSESLKRYPRVFDNMYVSMVRTGEASGTLEKVLNRLANFGEKQDDFMARVQAALAYPILIIAVVIVTLVVLFTFVIPRLVELFEEMGQFLPLPTRILIGISDFFFHFWWLMLGIALFAFFAVRRNFFTAKGRLAFDHFKLNLPVLGKFLKKVKITNFSRTLGTLLANGVPILQAMESVSHALGDEVFKQEVGRIAVKIRKGSTLAKEVTKSKLFPVMMGNMLSIGEETGRLEASLLKVAESYERETDQDTKILSSLIEPVMILVMGSLVAFIVIAMLLPIFQISLIAQ